MRIDLKQPGQPVADFSVSGAVVTVAGVEIDCAARQQDVSVTVEVRNNAGIAGIGGDGAYMAQITIPARTYAYQPDAGDESSEAREAKPLDPNAVVVTLWAVA
ncbi:MAG: hypothetical protein JNM98_18140 [Rhodocyclaceae bacterium]|nr:hypothetical protein [Rhodocyclaceae bacterium]